MAHCPYETLNDVESVFDQLRTWTSIREPKPGIFYFKSKPFLHFHIKSTDRWADIRSDASWERIDAPIPLSDKQKNHLINSIRTHYEKLNGAS